MDTEHFTQEYCLFLDESGLFLETSTDPAERAKAKPQPFPSQLAGFFAPLNDNISITAALIMKKCFEKARLPLVNDVHANDFPITNLNLLLHALIGELRREHWQPVRMVNKERVVYGSRVPTYTNMVAELVLRIIQLKVKHPTDRVRIHLTGAKVYLDEMEWSHGVKMRKTIKAEEYFQRVSDYFNFAAARRGLSRDQLSWDFSSSIELREPIMTPELQICDLLSNASHADYVKCSPGVKPMLREAFGAFDQTIETLDVLDRLEKLTRDQMFADALILIVETSYEQFETGYFYKACREKLDYILNRMVQIGVRGRDTHLTVIIAWLEQLIGEKRMAETGAAVAALLQADVSGPLRTRLKLLSEEHTMDWFDFAVNRWIITAANHRGMLRDAERALHAMRPLKASLAGNWERIPLLMDGVITEAVHQMDTFEFGLVGAQMQWITDVLGAQSKSLEKLMPDEIKGPIRYDLRAKAFGTLTMNLILSGLKTPTDLDRARAVSDQAIQEFTSINDKARQYQLRSHLETLAQNFDQARFYLLKSLLPLGDFETASHDQIAAAMIEEEKRGIPSFRFLIAHWLRIGAKAYLTDAKREAAAFISAFDRSKVQNSSLMQSRQFPIHIILRNIAVIQAAIGMPAKALVTLGHLRGLTGNNTEMLTLRAIEIAALAEVASVLWGQHGSRFLLNSDLPAYGGCDTAKPKAGIRQLLERIPPKNLASFPALCNKFNDWRAKLDSLDADDVEAGYSRSILLDIGRDVGY